MTVKAKPRSLMSYLETIPDPRVSRTRKHELVDILAVTLLAVLSDADTYEDIHEFGVEQEAWLKQSWPLANGIPSADTFSRVLQSLNPKVFGAVVGEWLAAACEATGLKHVAIDGKSIRAAKRDTFAGCLHLVTAWATENGLVLGQEAVADKSNEIPAIPELLKTLDLAGALVTIDAAGTQVEIARQIVAQGGDYLLPVKKNQPKLLAACEANFARAQATEFVGDDVTMDASVESKHGRIDERYTLALAKPTGLPAEWSDAKVVLQVNREREVNGKRTATTVYYVCSKRLAAKTLAQPIRRHWAIENELHWVLDMTFREDTLKTRNRNAGANLGLIRRTALTLLKRAPGKQSLKTKRKKAGWSPEYRLQLLQGFPEN